MRSRIDFVSKTTGRTYLKTMFDTPPEGLSAETALKIRNKLAAAAQELEDEIARDTGEPIRIRLTVDNYEASVFWYLVLFRPFYVTRESPLGSREWSVYELMRAPDKRHLLKRLDWGIFWDDVNNWLVLVWKEARKGVLKDLRNCPSWDAVLTKEEKRLHKRLDHDWWKLCAESSSFSIPVWQLKKMSYIRETLWHRPGMQYSDITVLDVSAIEIPQLEVGPRVTAKLPVAQRAHFAHHYVKEEEKAHYVENIRKFEKDEFKSRCKTEEEKKAESMRAEYSRITRNARRREKRAKNRDETQELIRIISEIGTVLGKAYRRGRLPAKFTAAESEKRFSHAVDSYINGEFVKPNWKRTEKLLDMIEQFLEANPNLPEVHMARRWLLWRNMGSPGVLAFIENRRGNHAAYRQIMQGLKPAKQQELTELIILLNPEEP